MLQNSLLRSAIATLILYATPSWTFELEDNSYLACKVSDAGNFLPNHFADQLCAQLSAKLNLPVSSLGIADRDQTVLVIKIQTLTNHRAIFELLAQKDDQLDENGNPILGPVLIETMDVALKNALPSHLQNDLKRFFGS